MMVCRWVSGLIVQAGPRTGAARFRGQVSVGGTYLEFSASYGYRENWKREVKLKQLILFLVFFLCFL